MQLRFGVAEGLSDATSISHVSAGDLGTRLFQHLALTDGPTMGPVPGASVPVAGGVWWALLVAMTVVAMAGDSGGPERGPVLLATFAGGAMAAEYLVLISGLAPRFLLPAYALLSLSAAIGIRTLLSSERRLAGAASVAVVASLGIWHLGVAVRVGNVVESSRASDRDVGLAVREAAGDRPCAMLASDSYPQVGFAARCIVRPTDGRGSGLEWLAANQARGYAAFVVTKGVSPGPPSSQEFPAPPGWRIFGSG
jgi:hypothetical protein